MRLNGFIFLLIVSVPCVAATLCNDEIVFGNTASETYHSVVAVNSATGIGGLGETYRKLLSYSPAQDYGGTVTFTVAVDPVKQNYLTLKMWGSDFETTNDQHIPLYLFCDGKQLGYRHEADLPPLDRWQCEPQFPNRFVYSTYILPLSMTSGKTSVTLMIQVWGYFWPYGADWDTCQTSLLEASRGLYRLYTHTDAFFEPDTSEAQGTKPEVGLSVPDSSQTVIELFQSEADSYVTTLLAKSASSLNRFQVMHLARVYESSWAAKYHGNDVLTKVRDALDYYVQYQNSTGDYELFGWTGHGELAQALLEVYSAMNAQGMLSQTIDHDLNSSTATITRRAAYADFFKDGRDWRMIDPRYFTNQAIFCVISAYASDKAVRLLDSSQAWSESYALQVAKRGAGILPWVYNRSLSYTWYFWDIQLPNPLGDYYIVTKKGLSRELAYACYYGEIGNLFARLAALTGDPDIKQQAIKYMTARAQFHFYDNDKNGYQAMRVEAAIGTRHNEETGRISYDDETFEVAAALQDPISTQYAQLYLQHNRPFSGIAYARDVDKVKRVNDYLTVLSLPPSNYHFPMGPGMPDFAWTDEENAVVVVKNGDIRFYAEMFFVTPAITNMCRLHYTTSTIDRVANVMLETQYTPKGVTMTREDNPAHGDSSKTPPPSGLNLHSYHAGQTLPVADGMFGGRADFYKLNYGPFLIGMNTTTNKTFNLTFPTGSPATAFDLVSGKMVLTSNPSVGPLTTMILVFDDLLFCGKNTGTSYLTGDLNSDCRVDLEDLAILTSHWATEIK